MGLEMREREREEGWMEGERERERESTGIDNCPHWIYWCSTFQAAWNYWEVWENIWVLGCDLNEFMFRSRKTSHCWSIVDCRDNLLVERRTRNRKVASSNPNRGGRRMFSFRVNFVCWLLVGVRSTPVLPQRQVKNPGHSATIASGRLHKNTHSLNPWPYEVGVG